MKRIKYIVLTLIIAASFGLIATPATVGAADVFTGACSGSAANTVLCQNKSDDIQSPIKAIVNTLLYVLGAVSVVVIIIAGILYTTSSGDAAAVTKAKNTLLYAVVGLVVAVLAFAIVNYVLASFK